MLLSQVGKRIDRKLRRKRSRGATGKREEALSRREKHALIQLVICGTAFVLLVGFKLLLPQRIEMIQTSVSSVIEQNMNIKEVFSAVGKAISGKKSVGESLEDVYQAVFFSAEPQLTTVIVQENIPNGQLSEGQLLSKEKEPLLSKEEDVQEVALELPEPEKLADVQEETPQPMELSYVLYSGEELPENVCMEQRILGFDFCTPVRGTVSSPFGYREHPTVGKERFHYGLDVAANNGTEILCFADGSVAAVGESSSYGKYLIVRHRNGYSTLYAHCSKITIRQGAEVQMGEKIAEVGETGMATGPHLHFELYDDGQYLNPTYYVDVPS